MMVCSMPYELDGGGRILCISTSYGESSTGLWLKSFLGSKIARGVRLALQVPLLSAQDIAFGLFAFG